MIAICYPKDGWILQRMAEELLARLPESIGLDYTSPGLWEPGSILDTGPQRINYFINYAIARRTTAKLDAALFTHPESDGLFWEIGRQMDIAVCMNDQYCAALTELGCRAVTILPGVDASYTPKLVLGFVGRFNSYGSRKGEDMLRQVSELDFVELVITDGQVSPEDLPAFYRKLDYVIITSRYEGGPMCLLEGLACGKKVICPPDVGFADRFPGGIVPYAKGDFASLAQTLRVLYEEKSRLSSLVREYTWDRWALEHLRVFTALLRGKTTSTGVGGLLPAARRASDQTHAINAYARHRNMDEINLHLGCGGQNLEGWINIDNYDYEAGDTSRSGASYDLKMDIRALDAAPDSVDSILLVHVLEHFVRWEALELLAQFHRLLKPGGLLIMEHPDLEGCIKMMYLEGSPTIDTPLGTLNKGFTQFYGNQWDRLDYETHRYVWTKKEMALELDKIGFEIVSLDNQAKFHVPERDMRVIARKKIL